MTQTVDDHCSANLAHLYSHYILALTERRGDQLQRAACGEWVFRWEHSTEPTCKDCLAFLSAPAPAKVDR